MCYNKSMNKHLILLIIAQALEDVLNYELGQRLTAARPELEPELYEDALLFVLKHPALRDRLKRADKRAWLKAIQEELL